MRSGSPAPPSPTCTPGRTSSPDELRERILQTAARLGYRGPNPAGRLLRSGRAGAVGVVLTESLAWAFADPYAVEFLAALAGVAEGARHALLLVPCPPGEDQREGIRTAVVDGFCVFTLPDDHPIVEEVLCRALPDGVRRRSADRRPPLRRDRRPPGRRPTSPITCWPSATVGSVCSPSASGPTVGPARPTRPASRPPTSASRASASAGSSTPRPRPGSLATRCGSTRWASTPARRRTAPLA